MTNNNSAWVGFLRGLLGAIVFAVVGYAANAVNLTPVLGAGTAAIVAGLALALEHAFSPTGSAMFGAVKN